MTLEIDRMPRALALALAQARVIADLLARRARITSAQMFAARRNNAPSTRVASER